MIIRANEKEIQINNIFSDTMIQGTNIYPALRFEFEKEATYEDIQALLSEKFEILDDSGEVIGTHEGYNTLKAITVTIGKITTAEQKVEELEAALANAQQEKAELEASLATVQEENTELQDALDIIVGGNV